MIFNDVINQQQFVLPYFQTSSFPKVNDFFESIDLSLYYMQYYTVLMTSAILKT